MTASLPSSLALTTTPDGSNIVASTPRNNDAAIQTAVNALISALSGGSAGQLLQAQSSTSVAYVDVLPWLIDIDVFATSVSQVNWDNATIADPSEIYGDKRVTTTAQNNEINWDVVLAAGTWTVELMYVKGTDAGIFNVQFDGVTVGTIDSYNASFTYNNRSSVTGITVGSTGKKRLKLLMATKNASSSAFAGRVQHIQLRRTA